jgi:hypothetical protein
VTSHAGAELQELGKNVEILKLLMLAKMITSPNAASRNRALYVWRSLEKLRDHCGSGSGVGEPVEAQARPGSPASLPDVILASAKTKGEKMTRKHVDLSVVCKTVLAQARCSGYTTVECCFPVELLSCVSMHNSADDDSPAQHTAQGQESPKAGCEFPANTGTRTAISSSCRRPQGIKWLQGMLTPGTRSSYMSDTTTVCAGDFRGTTCDEVL